MRTRTRSTPRSFLGLVGARAPGNLTDTIRLGYYSSSSYSPWGGSPGPYMIDDSTIVDDVSFGTPGAWPYRSCTHTKYHGALIAGEKQIRFSPPTANLILRVDHEFMYKPSISVSSGPWATMLDELASLADGSVSDAAQLPVSLWEASKTIAMMRNPFNLLKPRFRRQVGKLTASVLAKRSADLWLEGYYGWKSLFQDTESIARSTAAILDEPNRSYLEKLGSRLSVQKTTVSLADTVSYTVGTSAATWETAVANNWIEYGQLKTGHFARLINHSRRSLHRLGCQQLLEVSSKIDYGRRIFSNYGCSNWRDFRDVIWEVVPFSFVVDWFVDMRGMWAPLNRLRLGESDISRLGYSTLDRGEYDVELYISPRICYYTSSQWGYKAPTSVVGSHIVRSITKGSYQIYSRSPGFPLSDNEVLSAFNGKGLTFIRGINGAALLAQLFSKPKH